MVKNRYETINDEVICYLDNIKSGVDLNYHLLLNGQADYEDQYALEFSKTKPVHYIIKDFNFDSGVSVLSYDSVVEFINCSFHGQIYFMEAQNVIFNNCEYYTDKFSVDYDEEPNYIVGKVNELKFLNDNLFDKQSKTYNFNIKLYQNKKLDIINTNVKYDLLDLESEEINVIDSNIKCSDKVNRIDTINSINTTINNSELSVDDIYINSDLEIINSNIEVRNKIQINSLKDVDINSINSPSIILNGTVLNNHEYSIKTLERIRLKNTLKELQKEVNKNINIKVNNYRDELNNSSIKELIKK